MKTPRLRQILLLVLAIGLLGGFGYVVARTGPLAAVRVTVASPERCDLQPALFGIGTVEARRAYAIGPTNAGRVQQVRVDVGDVVAAGQLVAEMDPVDLDDRTAAAQAALERAGNVLAAAEAQVREAVSRRELAEASAMSADYNDDWLSSGFVKLFMDGVMDSGTAYMINDYPDQPGWRCEPLHTPEEFNAVAIEADRRGLQIAVHAIGDGAVRQVVDGY